MPTTNFPYGVTNAAEGSALSDFVSVDPTKVHQYFEDFDYYVAAGWTVTETQAGATQALTNADGGILALVNSAADDDLNAMQKVGESFLFETKKKLWFKARFKVSDATQSDVVIGLQITDTTPLAVSDGVYFLKSDGSTTMNLLVTKNATSTTTAATTLADNTYVTAGFYYNGNDDIQIFVNDVAVAHSAVTNLPDDEELTVSFAIQNGEAAAKTLSVDYIFVAKER